MNSDLRTFGQRWANNVCYRCRHNVDLTSKRRFKRRFDVGPTLGQWCVLSGTSWSHSSGAYIFRRAITMGNRSIQTPMSATRFPAETANREIEPVSHEVCQAWEVLNSRHFRCDKTNPTSVHCWKQFGYRWDTWLLGVSSDIKVFIANKDLTISI